MRKIFLSFLFLTVWVALVSDVSAQRSAVSGKEVTGTFSTGGKNPNTVKIAALGGGRLQVEFSLIYTRKMDNGEWMANTGEPSGIASIEADTAVLDLSEEDRPCRITIKFVKPGLIEVDHDAADCAGIIGGMNVTAFGEYKKISSTKPKFKE